MEVESCNFLKDSQNGLHATSKWLLKRVHFEMKFAADSSQYNQFELSEEIISPHTKAHPLAAPSSSVLICKAEQSK